MAGKITKGKRRWWLRILMGLILVGLVLPLVTIFVIRWRTTTAWEKFRSEWEAKGEKFALEDHIPGPVPDEQNLARHPLFVDLHRDGAPTPPWINTIDLKKVPGFDEKSSKARKDLCENADFAGWQSIPADATPAERLAEIRKRLAPLDDPLDQVAKALEERPLCRYDLPWEDTLQMQTPHVFAFLNLTKAFSTRASLRLASDDAEGAAQDIVSTHHVARAVGGDPHLISFLVEIAAHASALNVLWDGLDRRAFTATDLQRLEAALAAIDPLPERLLPCLRMERAMFLRFLDDLETAPKGAAGLPASGSPGGAAGFVVRMWMSASRLGACEDMQETVLAPGGTMVTRPDWKSFDEWELRLEKRWSGSRKFIEAFAALATPALGTSGRRAFLVEAEFAHARIAISLERHRLAHGSYPAALGDLVPAYLPALPEDRVNGRRIDYLLMPDGTPKIYQWGFDGDDDGGRPRKNPLQGDIVWQYALPPGFTEADWKRRD